MISEEALAEMGFEKVRPGCWARELKESHHGNEPIRIRVIPYSDDWIDVRLEQAEYTGDLYDGVGDSDWSWKNIDAVDVLVAGERELRILVELLETGVVKQ